MTAVSTAAKRYEARRSFYQQDIFSGFPSGRVGERQSASDTGQVSKHYARSHERSRGKLANIPKQDFPKDDASETFVRLLSVNKASQKKRLASLSLKASGHQLCHRPHLNSHRIRITDVARRRRDIMCFTAGCANAAPIHSFITCHLSLSGDHKGRHTAD